MADVLTKLDAQKDGEAAVNAFRQNLGPFVVAAQKTRMPMVFTEEEPGHPIIFANDAFLALAGYTREEVLAKSFQSLLAVGADAETMPIVEAAFRGECDSEPEIHYRRRDNSEFWPQCSSVRCATRAEPSCSNSCRSSICRNICKIAAAPQLAMLHDHVFDARRQRRADPRERIER